MKNQALMIADISIFAETGPGSSTAAMPKVKSTLTLHCAWCNFYLGILDLAIYIDSIGEEYAGSTCVIH